MFNKKYPQTHIELIGHPREIGSAFYGAGRGHGGKVKKIRKSEDQKVGKD